jgi:hypothetical protein
MSMINTGSGKDLHIYGNAAATRGSWSNSLSTGLRFIALTKTSTCRERTRRTEQSENGALPLEARSASDKHRSYSLMKIGFCSALYGSISGLLWSRDLWFQLVENIPRILLSDSHIFGMASSGHDLVVLVQKLDGGEGKRLAN